MGGSSKASRASAGAIEAQRRMLRDIDSINTPDIERMRVALESPELLEQEALLLGPSAMENISLNPETRAAQILALQQMAELGETGLRPEDLAAGRMIGRGVAGEAQSALEGLDKQARARGIEDSGIALQQALDVSGEATNQELQRQADIVNQNLSRRRGALASQANLAGNLRSSDYGEAAQQASARDAIEAFNLAQSRQKSLERQQYADQAVDTANQQQIYNKGLLQQDFQNRMAKASAASQQLGNQASLLQQQSAAKQAAAQQKGGALGSIAGTLAGVGLAAATGGGSTALSLGAGMGGSIGGGLGVGISDRNEKENIRKPSTEEVMGGVEEMLEKVTPYKYDYKNPAYGEGEQMGVMAQDLEKSELGRQFVSRAGGEGGQEDIVNPDAPKVVEYGNMQGAQLAGLAALYEKVKGLEKKVDKKKGK